MTMPIELKMPALSPTMEEGTLAKWLVKVGDTVKSGDVMAEIETDKATMEFEAVDEGVIASIAVAEGTEGVKVGTVIATIAAESEDASTAPGAAAPIAAAVTPGLTRGPATSPVPAPSGTPDQVRGDAEKMATLPAAVDAGDRILVSPLAKRLAAEKGVDLSTLNGTGPNGRIIKADVEGASDGFRSFDKALDQPNRVETAAPKTDLPKPVEGPSAVKAAAPFATDIPHEAVKLSNIRKVIARRLTESKQTIPHIYLTVDIRLDALLKLRGELNGALEPRGVKLSVNDMLIKALALSLIEVPVCNVSFAGDTLIKYSRADISVAVSTPTGLITPIVADAASKAMSAISVEMKVLADKAKAGKLQPHEFQGGTASLSNMGMFGIKQFEAVINPPQAMIMAIGAGEKRPYIVDDALGVATVMSATGSFDHRAIDGSDGAQLMKAFKALVESPLGLVA